MKWICFFLLIFALFGCGPKKGDLVFKVKEKPIPGNALLQGNAPLGFESLQKYILKPKCMGCHSGPDARPENDPIDFSTYDSTTVDRFVPLFLKGEPERSRLYQTVFNGEMPISMKLHDKEIQFIKDWIKACAPYDAVDSIPDNCDDDGDDDDCDFDDDDCDDDF